jgi:peptide-methionine (S)-S-oxide reductase
MMENATFGGGCFWCTEAVFDRIQGVESVVSGYTGGHLPNPTYDQVCAGDTGHAEVIQLTFDPAVITYREILEIFFATHDPTTQDRQGNDVGEQYRSIIFAHDDEQELVAREVIDSLTAENVFEAPIVTQVDRMHTFWPAEDSHQKFFAQSPGQPYCVFVIAPKVAKLREQFAHRLKS